MLRTLPNQLHAIDASQPGESPATVLEGAPISGTASPAPVDAKQESQFDVEVTVEHRTVRVKSNIPQMLQLRRSQSGSLKDISVSPDLRPARKNNKSSPIQEEPVDNDYLALDIADEKEGLDHDYVAIDIAPEEGEVEPPHRLASKLYDCGTTIGKDSLKGSVALVAAASSAVNCMMNPTKSQPKDIGSDWWNNMSLGQKTESIWNLVASLVVNFIFAVVSIPDAFHKLEKIFKEPGHRGEKAKVLILGISAAIAAAAISLSAFSWTSPIIAWTVAGASLGINFTTRLVGVKNLMIKLRGFFNDNVKLKNQCVDTLNRVKKEYIAELNTVIADLARQHGGKLNDTVIKDLFERLENRSQQIDLIRDKTGYDTTAEYAGFLFDVTLATVIGFSALPTFTQKGFDGIAALSEKIASVCGSDLDMESLPAYAKALIGFLPGSATAMLYAVSALDIRHLIVDIASELWNKPRILPTLTFGFFGVANYYASGSMQNVAEGVLKNENRICSFLTSENASGSAYAILNRLGGGVTNAKSNFARLFSNPSTENPELIDVIKYLKQKHVENKLSDGTYNALQNLSILKPKAPAPAQTTTHPTGYAPLRDGEGPAPDLDPSLRAYRMV